MEQIDWTLYLDQGLTDEEVEQSTTLIEDIDLEKEAYDLLQRCYQYYQNLDKFRKERADSRNFYIGDQWSRLIKDPDTGEMITEEQHINNQGQVALKQNQIRQVVKNLLGQFRDNDNTSMAISRKRESQKVGEMLTNTLHYALQSNKTKELDVRQFEEFLVSGMFGWKESFGWHKERNIDDVVIDPVHPARVFFNTGITDIRLKEIHTIGEVLDVELHDILSVFAKNDADKEKIKEWYGIRGERHPHSLLHDDQDSRNIDNIDFFLSDDLSKCRVIECWSLKNEKVLIAHDRHTGEVYESDQSPEDIIQENELRVQSAMAFGVPEENVPLIEFEERFENIWYFWYLTPRGKILQHGRTPFSHESHPYTLGIYPLIDGNIFGLVHDIKDQQININQMMTLLRFIIGASAKGVLLFPEDMLPDGYDLDDISEEWVRYNGVIGYKPSSKHNQLPKQIIANSQNAGAMDMLQMQFKLLENISGVSGSIQGQTAKSGTPSSRYAQETNNASLNNKDFFDFFFSVKKQRDFKIIKIIQQFYDDERYINVAGKDVSDDMAYYKPELGRDAEFEISMGQSTSSTAYRQILDDYLMEFLQAGFIDFDIFLDNTSMPFKDRLRESINNKKQELAQSGAVENPQTMALFNQMIGQQPQKS